MELLEDKSARKLVEGKGGRIHAYADKDESGKWQVTLQRIVYL